MQQNEHHGANNCTLTMALPSELLLESFTALNESLLCGHDFFLRGLPLRFGAENKWRAIDIHFHWHGFPSSKPSILLQWSPSRVQTHVRICGSQPSFNASLPEGLHLGRPCTSALLSQS